MPGLTFHYIIALKSIEKNNVTNIQEYIDGSFYPDFYQKPQSHYTDNSKVKKPLDKLLFKVDLEAFVKEHTINTDHDKGYFLHLLTDYLFYHDLCIEKYAHNPDFIRCLHNLGVEYTKINKALYELYKYDNTYINSEYLQFFTRPDEDPEFFTHEELKNFIEHCAALDLNKEYNNIKKGVLPTFKLFFIVNH